MEERETRRVVLGRIAGLHGVRGWVKVLSYTEPRANILTYANWHLRSEDGWRIVAVAEGRGQGDRILARLDGMNDRDRAAAVVGADIAVLRTELPATDPGEYYWSDLEGLQVLNLGGEHLGRVTRLFATGANDVMVVVAGVREHLLPFVHGTVIKDVDLVRGEIRVDWDAEF